MCQWQIAYNNNATCKVEMIYSILKQKWLKLDFRIWINPLRIYSKYKEQNWIYENYGERVSTFLQRQTKLF